MNSENWRDELHQAYVAKWQAHEAEESERRRREGKAAIWFTSGPDDAETFTKEHQEELRDVISDFREQGIKLEAPFLTVDAVDAVSGYTGQLIISIAQIASPVVTAALLTWLKGRSGRKVRVEFHPSGKLKIVEAQTDEQVVSIAKELAQEASTQTPESEAE